MCIKVFWLLKMFQRKLFTMHFCFILFAFVIIVFSNNITICGQLVARCDAAFDMCRHRSELELSGSHPFVQCTIHRTLYFCKYIPKFTENNRCIAPRRSRINQKRCRIESSTTDNAYADTIWTLLLSANNHTKLVNCCY